MNDESHGLILDMDGVIVDSEPIHKRADALTFASVGLDVPVRTLQEYAGFGADVFFKSILDRFGASADPAELRSRKNAFLAELLGRGTPAVAGIRELIDLAGSRGMKRAVASSSDLEIVTLVLSNLGLSDRFDAVITGSSVARGKPAPDIYLAAAAALDLKPRACVAVEDSGAGVKAAVRAGVMCIGFRNPLSGSQDLSPAHAVVGSLAEIDAEMMDSLFDS